MSDLNFVYRDPAQLKETADNPNTHPPGQIDNLVAAFAEFGMIVPLGIDQFNNVIFGAGRRLAAIQAGLSSVPCVLVTHLDARQKRAFKIADKKLTAQSAWDWSKLSAGIDSLLDEGFDVDVLGFDDAEFDNLLSSVGEMLPEEETAPVVVAAHERKISKKSNKLVNAGEKLEFDLIKKFGAGDGAKIWNFLQTHRATVKKAFR